MGERVGAIAGAITMSARPGQPPDGEGALIARLIAGDERAWYGVYRQHAADVFRVARRFVESDADAEEVVQEVFIAAHRYIGRFRGQSRLRTWLYRVTVNRALKRRRWRGRRREAGADALGHRAALEAAPDTRASDREALLVVQRCLDQLEVRKRTVLVLHELEGLDTKEIAEILGCPRSTVLTRLSRARGELLRLARRHGIRVEGREGGA